LKNIHIANSDTIHQFIYAIDSNPNPEYLNSVRTLDINDKAEHSSVYQFSNGVVQKLFLRFPNIQRITIYGVPALLEKFDNDRLMLQKLEKSTLSRYLT
jgi:hypothetical protein